MKLLVTGGAGFLGSHFVRSVLGGVLPGLTPDRVVVLDKLTYAGTFGSLGPVAEDSRLDFVPGDTAEAALVAAVIRDVDMIVNIATDVTGTQTLLDAAVAHGVSRFVQVSTGDVYGPIDTGAWGEDAAVAPHSPYAATKAAADLLALACHRTHGLPVVVTRGAATYGPYQHPEKLVPRVVTGVLTGRTVPLNGEGRRIRDWVHADDHCRGIALALTAGRPGATYHIGGTPRTGGDLVSRLLDLCGAGPDAVVPGISGGPIRRYAISDAQTREALGYEPRTALDEGLAATVHWNRTNEPWWRSLVS